MLYHWHELNPESATEAEFENEMLSEQERAFARYDRIAAVSRARGDYLRLRDDAVAPKAANDSRPDTVAVQLRAAGLGVLGDPAHRASPCNYSGLTQATNSALWFRRLITSILPTIAHTLSYSSRKIVAGCSHTMVSNNTDGRQVETIDAQRQRFASARRS